jgi:hypothetical protein
MEAQELKRFRVPSGLGATSSKLIELLAAGKVGDVLTDEALTEACGADTRPNGKGYGALGTAIRYVVRNHQLVWRRVKRADALKCYNASEILTIGEANRQHIGKTARRTVNVMACAKLDELSDADKTRAVAMLAQHGALAAMAGGDVTKKLAARKTGEIDMKKLLTAMVG